MGCMLTYARHHAEYQGKYDTLNDALESAAWGQEAGEIHAIRIECDDGQKLEGEELHERCWAIVWASDKGA